MHQLVLCSRKNRSIRLIGTKLDPYWSAGMAQCGEPFVRRKVSGAWLPQPLGVITSEGVGKFPDTNISEALQSVSGLSISRENGEGERVWSWTGAAAFFSSKNGARARRGGAAEPGATAQVTSRRLPAEVVRRTSSVAGDRFSAQPARKHPEHSRGQSSRTRPPAPRNRCSVRGDLTLKCPASKNLSRRGWRHQSKPFVVFSTTQRYRSQHYQCSNTIVLGRRVHPHNRLKNNNKTAQESIGIKAAWHF